MNIRDYWGKNNTNKLNTSRIQVRILRMHYAYPGIDIFYEKYTTFGFSSDKKYD